jgi:thymidine phosphorylase
VGAGTYHCGVIYRTAPAVSQPPAEETGQASGSLVAVDADRTDMWRAMASDPTGPSFVRLAAATHLVLTGARPLAPFGGCPPDATALATELGVLKAPAAGHAGYVGPRADGDLGGRAMSAARSVIRRTLESRPVGQELLTRWIESVSAGTVSRDVVALWLAVMTHRRLSENDLLFLTEAMTRSGSTFDYRHRSYFTVRRYPTGGMSEKLALILPVLVGEAARTEPVRSAFLVARSLGHTGGTWDKLSAIPGFRFPQPGSETRRAMARSGVAMIVSNATFCPADRILYSLRSLTDTVRSTDLIVSSIASKLCAARVDDSVLDVRYGPHSFLPDYGAAAHHAALIRNVAATQDVAVSPVLTEDNGPDGSGIGNALEVAESLAVLGIGPSEGWDSGRVEHQRNLAARMLDQMLTRHKPGTAWDQWALDRMTTEGSLSASYGRLLNSHAVGPHTARNLLRDPAATLSIPDPEPLMADRSGIVRAVDYTAIGRLVNHQLARQHLPVNPAPGNDGSASAHDLTAGVKLRAAVGQRVAAGDVIMEVYTQTPLDGDTARQLTASYQIEVTT